ncbi:hypothetical protein SDJN02_00662, partial [Cucurbita argyrosperma subsp. argyrosperma]
MVSSRPFGALVRNQKHIRGTVAPHFSEIVVDSRHCGNAIRNAVLRSAVVVEPIEIRLFMAEQHSGATSPP